MVDVLLLKLLKENYGNLEAQRYEFAFYAKIQVLFLLTLTLVRADNQELIRKQELLFSTS